MFIRNGVWAIISRVKELLLNTFIFKSLRFRIFILLMLVGVLPIAIVGTVITGTYQKNAISQKTSQMTAQCRVLAGYLQQGGYLLQGLDEEAERELDQFSALYDGRILVVDDDYRIIHDTYDMYDMRTIISKEVLQCFSGIASDNYDRTNHYIELTIPITDMDSGDCEGVMVASCSTGDIYESTNLLKRNILTLQSLVFVVLLVISIWLSNILLRPFKKITAAIKDVESSISTDTISVKSYSEMEPILLAINSLLLRLKKLDESRQEFVSNVSHELKTPLASIKVLADSLIVMGDEVPVEMYRDFMNDITHEIDRENSIITDLLSLVKMDKTNAELNIRQMNINELVELILKRLGPLAAQKGVSLVFESERNVEAEVDEVKLTLAITNLVENAIKYNHSEGWVRVSLDADHQFFLLNVADSGIGIPEDSIDHVFERFYRVDKSHSREIGGTGLGLAITRNAILMHKGAIRVESSLGEGTVFQVRIPLNYIK